MTAKTTAQQESGWLIFGFADNNNYGRLVFCDKCTKIFSNLIIMMKSENENNLIRDANCCKKYKQITTRCNFLNVTTNVTTSNIENGMTPRC